jgi:hypothetical protein
VLREKCPTQGALPVHSVGYSNVPCASSFPYPIEALVHAIWVGLRIPCADAIRSG